MLLAGAKAVQAASSLYRNGAGQRRRHAAGAVERGWIGTGIKTLADFRGKLSQAESVDPGRIRARAVHEALRLRMREAR